MKFDKMSYIGINDENKCNKVYGWKFQIMLRNMKKIMFHHRFHELIPFKSDGDNNGLIEFKLIGAKENDFEKMDLFPIYPWKSETFKGKENGVFEMDFVLLNDENNILSAKSVMSHVVPIKDLYNFDDQCNNYRRYFFQYKNINHHLEIFNMIQGNMIILDECDYKLENLSLYLSL